MSCSMIKAKEDQQNLLAKVEVILTSTTFSGEDYIQ